ncbi:hypothetical protein PILCRDRAFT_238349 [Piloderma croceum F 1598]|uniref:Uncharacterized protein n=1 Tax=Piloderma croceum (strain F 1598) TaxID=765440 RepID=A0A0C3GDQ6_PILCF|nr:hypothetical protein PILCRDRAFT_238349 [Piloderma croceum F 1598]
MYLATTNHFTGLGGSLIIHDGFVVSVLFSTAVAFVSGVGGGDSGSLGGGGDCDCIVALDSSSDLCLRMESFALFNFIKGRLWLGKITYWAAASSSNGLKIYTPDTIPNYRDSSTLA